MIPSITALYPLSGSVGCRRDATTRPLSSTTAVSTFVPPRSTPIVTPDRFVIIAPSPTLESGSAATSAITPTTLAPSETDQGKSRGPGSEPHSNLDSGPAPTLRALRLALHPDDVVAAVHVQDLSGHASRQV